MSEYYKPGSQMKVATAPLDGITVVAVEHAIAAPLCTRQLAELGARVIKVERREGGDFARHYDSRVNGQSSHFVWTNRCKESLTLDLKHPRAHELMYRLLSDADVLVQNLAPSAASRMGLGYEELAPHFRQLIVCNISGYGESGPYAGKKAYDLLVQAEAGFLSVTGLPDALVKSGISIADIAAGMQAYAAILAALIQRGKTGHGSRIDISMLEAMVEWMGFPLYYAYAGAEPPLRTGADHASIYPYGVFTAQDGTEIMIGLQNEREWKSFCDSVLESQALVDDSRFAGNADRAQNRQALRDIIQKTFSHHATDSILQKLDSAHIAYAKVNDMAAVWNHPQLEALQRFVELDTPAGKVQTLLPPGRNSGYAPVMSAVPELGQHTHGILRELGYKEQEITTLSDENVV